MCDEIIGRCIGQLCAVLCGLVVTACAIVCKDCCAECCDSCCKKSPSEGPHPQGATESYTQHASAIVVVVAVIILTICVTVDCAQRVATAKALGRQQTNLTRPRYNDINPHLLSVSTVLIMAVLLTVAIICCSGYTLYFLILLWSRGYCHCFSKRNPQSDGSSATPNGQGRSQCTYSVILLLSVAFTYLVIRWLFIFVCDKDCRSCACWKKSPEARPARGSTESNQTADIWNISGRVNHQEGGPITSEPQRWPTHDHHVSMDSFVVSSQAHKTDRIPPPPYCEVDLPTYEQATSVAATEVPSVHVAPSSSRTIAGPTS